MSTKNPAVKSDSTSADPVDATSRRAPLRGDEIEWTDDDERAANVAMQKIREKRTAAASDAAQ